MDASAARKSFSQLYHEVAYGRERVVIDHHGKGLAALVPAADLAQLIALDHQLQTRPAAPPERRLGGLIDTLRPLRTDLEQLGIRHLAIFGSFARGTEHEGSDIDVLLDVDPEAHFDLFDLAGIRERLVALFDREVDIVTTGALDDEFCSELSRDAVYVF